MSFIKSRVLKFVPSISTDVVAHRIRIVLDGTAFAASLPFVDVAYTSVTPRVQIAIDLATLANAPKANGTYDVYVTAIDAAGNESDPMAIANTVFDFTPPMAPTAGVIE